MSKKVMKLSSMLKYTHSRSILEAVLDEDFKTPFTPVIAKALRLKDAKKAEKALESLQKIISKEALEKTRLALDYYGFMYDYMPDVPPMNLKERFRTLETKETPKPKKAEKVDSIQFIETTRKLREAGRVGRSNLLRKNSRS